MTRTVTFALPAEIDSDVLARAPVAVMDHDFALVTETRLGQEVGLDPGIFVARTVLPDGREFETAFEVQDEGNIDPIVLVDQDQLKQELQEVLAAIATASEGVVARAIKTVPNVLRGAVGYGASVLRDLGVAWESRRSRLLLVSIDPASGIPSDHRELQVDEWGKVDIEPSTARRIVRLECPGKADLNIAVPTSPSEGARVRFAPGTDLVLDVRLQDEDAELMRRYLVSSRAQQLSQTLESQWDKARAMLSGKFERPIAATVGAYALISVGTPAGKSDDRPLGPGWLSQWTGTLFHECPWLPDGAYLEAEILARQGQHSQALDSLLDEIPHRGLPLFSLGLRFALDRLSAYRSAAGSVDWATERKEKINALLESLSAVAFYCDFSQPLLTFTTNADGLPGDDLRTAGDPIEIPAPAVMYQG